MEIKFKPLLIPICYLVVTLWSDTKCTQNVEGNTECTPKVPNTAWKLDDEKKYHLKESIKNDVAVRSEYKWRAKDAKLSECIPYWQSSSYFFQFLSTTMTGIAAFSQTHQFGMKLPPRAGLYCSIGALFFLTMDNLFVKPHIIKLTDAPKILDSFVSQEAKKFAKALDIQNEEHVKIILKIEIEDIVNSENKK